MGLGALAINLIRIRRQTAYFPVCLKKLTIDQ
jgi:hypothetical protein